MSVSPARDTGASTLTHSGRLQRRSRRRLVHCNVSSANTARSRATSELLLAQRRDGELAPAGLRAGRVRPHRMQCSRGTQRDASMPA